jgi:hypothetical protein
MRFFRLKKIKSIALNELSKMLLKKRFEIKVYYLYFHFD